MSTVAQVKRMGRPRSGDSVDTRLRLLLVAQRAFARNGYGSTTNKEIAEAVGLTTGAIYYYYPSKAALYGAVYAQVQTTIYAEFGRSLLDHDGLVERFAAVLDSAVVLNRRDSSIAGFVVAVPTEERRHPELGEMIRTVRRSNESFIARLVQDASDRGELAADVDTATVVDLFTAVLSGLARLADQIGDPDRHAAAAAALKRLVGATLFDRALYENAMTTEMSMPA